MIFFIKRKRLQVPEDSDEPELDEGEVKQFLSAIIELDHFSPHENSPQLEGLGILFDMNRFNSTVH